MYNLCHMNMTLPICTIAFIFSFLDERMIGTYLSTRSILLMTIASSISDTADSRFL